ncbi:complement C1q subcomponent subunit A-like isoform X2 [Ostrea edulis]|nr:complement C1q subcomponent subunit A-like isoform X2 [Ostrea edulis]XP_055999792.1 complement C1q subcomponent subunit A-like isoform X2 [Ostrea edulis]XP_055999793.1 complement C1q subcomponent subunit A-like isoform X2 [Ostrea edulis]XP_055999794.1 complement C1q subcomponent subunit A-like isoform X2 [Ostrea edulis]XP_055999795.1 complement C1q subcomponent subunit A-like isoform X2 [Ostrea edulis]
MMKYILFCAAIGLISGDRGGKVAFTALLSKHTTVGAYAVVKYDRVLTNWGGAYQPTTGVFTAPYNGLYSISCTLMSDPINYAHASITKNGKKMSVVFSNTKTYPHASQTLQLLLNKGDKIWIQNRNGRKTIFHDHGYSNVFSGFLIDEL